MDSRVQSGIQWSWETVWDSMDSGIHSQTVDSEYQENTQTDKDTTWHPDKATVGWPASGLSTNFNEKEKNSLTAGLAFSSTPLFAPFFTVHPTLHPTHTYPTSVFSLLIDSRPSSMPSPRENCLFCKNSSLCFVFHWPSLSLSSAGYPASTLPPSSYWD